MSTTIIILIFSACRAALVPIVNELFAFLGGKQQTKGRGVCSLEL